MHEQAAPGPGWWLATDGLWYPPDRYPTPGPYPGVTGHGWWQATDGAWYPWERHPAHPPVTGPSPRRPDPGRGTRIWVAVLLTGLVVGGALLAVGLLASREDPTAGPVGPDPTGAPVATGGVVAGVDPGTLPEVTGSDGEPWNLAAAAAIEDLEGYWGETMPDVFGIEFVPIAGGFYAFSPGEELPPCAAAASDLELNAYYCEPPDVVAWDDTFLLPDIYEFSGDLGVALVIAHEWGHAVQARVGFTGATITFEQQADCYAGAWFGHVRDGGSDLFRVTDADLDRALANLLELGDQPGVAANDPFAHGSAFDRINAFQQGIEGGATVCAAISDTTIEPTALPFTTADVTSGGDLPLADMVRLAVEDLDAYWGAEFPARHGAPWTPPAGGVVAYQGGDRPGCGTPAVDAAVFYCADGDFIAVPTDGLAAEVYASFGDFAVGALVGIEYARAVLVELEVDPRPLDAALRADCLAGAWSASMFPANIGDREAAGTSVVVLSAGDLDEAVATLLVLGGGDPTAGTGFQRVTAFRDGFVGGQEAC